MNFSSDEHVLDCHDITVSNIIIVFSWLDLYTFLPSIALFMELQRFKINNINLAGDGCGEPAWPHLRVGPGHL